MTKREAPGPPASTSSANRSSDAMSHAPVPITVARRHRCCAPRRVFCAAPSVVSVRGERRTNQCGGAHPTVTAGAGGDPVHGTGRNRPSSCVLQCSS